MEQESPVWNSQRSGTKERIIDAAFSFYKEFVFEKVSLSRIAAKVGISKPAIFKHFSSKDSLMEAMDERVFSHLTLVLQDMEQLLEEGRLGEALSRMIGHLALNREETFYLFSTLPGITIDSIFMRLRTRGISLFNNIFESDGSVKDRNLYYLTVFTSSTFLYFLLLWFSSPGALQEHDDGFPATFIGKFNTLVQDGLCDLERIEDFEAVESACEAGMKAAKPLNRAFEALVSVIRKKGAQGVTVEGIASELGLAKSSLYSSFKNKDEMLRTLVGEELANFYEVIQENVGGLSSHGDRIYAIMRTSMLYFIARPGILSIFKGIVLSGQHPSLGGGGGCQQLDWLVGVPLVPSLPDVGIEGFDQKMLLSWFFSLPAMLYMHCRVHRWEDDDMLLAVRKMYDFLVCGINGWKTLAA
ncbi:MAG: TetR/AcrR family transcriptional regulator [Treponema sp.]|nr:TetR/AcrR family transcriptional regulator [Treponema sp.]